MPFMDLNKAYDWFGELLEIQAIANDITSEYVPPHFVPFQLDFFMLLFEFDIGYYMNLDFNNFILFTLVVTCYSLP